MNLLSSVSPFVSAWNCFCDVQSKLIMCALSMLNASAIYVKIYTFVTVPLTHSWVGEY